MYYPKEIMLMITFVVICNKAPKMIRFPKTVSPNIISFKIS